MEASPVYLLFGGAGTIGSATARQLHAQGARLVIAGRRAAPLEALAAELGCAHLVADATDADAVEQAGGAALERYGRLDGLVNFAGSILLKPAHLTRPEEFAQVVSQNLVTAFNVVRAAGKLVRGSGSVVLMSSAAARTGLPNHEAIAAAKAGVIGLARSAAATYASRGLRFNVVAPGLVRSEMSARITATPQGEEASRSMHPLGRLGEAGDIAPVVAWLLGDASSWVTGEVFGADGGLASVRARSA
jgi:NAD(P)-dependent dehydrogenase (short-subunit alcohol dehydrogenase family)